SSLVVGLLSFAELLPVLFAGLIGGVLADALERRSLILGTQAVALASAGALVANALLWRQLWLVIALAALLAGAFRVPRPSVAAPVPPVVRAEALPAAAARAGLRETIPGASPPLLAGGVLTAGFPRACVVAGEACAAGLGPFARMRPCPPAHDADRPSLRGIA